MANSNKIAYLLISTLLIPVSLAGADLTAADFDDNLNYDHFRIFMDGEYQKDSNGILPAVDLSNRVTLEVTDNDGRGLPDHGLRILDNSTGKEVLESHTGFDGRFGFFPGFDDDGGTGSYDIVVPDGDEEKTFNLDIGQLDEDRTFDIILDDERFNTPSVLDICFVIDTTGSMGDELEYIKREMNGIISGINDTYQVERMRFALVVYRDIGDEYLVKDFDFTSSIDVMKDRLSAQVAKGGGDYPEAMDMALQKANLLSWSEGNAARIMFLVADAPPHNAYLEDTIRWIKDSRSGGIHIYPLASSGVADVAEFMMRIAAIVTHGRYLFLTDDSGIGNPHAEPHVPGYVVTTLKNLMIRIVDSELSGHRVEPRPEDIIRIVGNVKNCSVVSDEVYNRTADDDPLLPEDGGTKTAEEKGTEDVSITEEDPVVSVEKPASTGKDEPSHLYALDPVEDEGEAFHPWSSPINLESDDQNGVLPSISILLITVAVIAGGVIVMGYAIRRTVKEKK